MQEMSVIPVQVVMWHALVWSVWFGGLDDCAPVWERCDGANLTEEHGNQDMGLMAPNSAASTRKSVGYGVLSLRYNCDQGSGIET